MEQTMTINDQLTELGTLVDNENTAVQRVGAKLVEAFLNTHGEDSIADVETTANLLYYLTDIQVRDYALGLLSDNDYSHTANALKYLVDQAPTDTIYINAPAALLAQLYYEQGNTADAFLMLSNAQENYSLALLLSRVFKSGWDPKSFARMREELHPKVVAGIFGEEN
jgi:TolA-binding protein